VLTPQQVNQRFYRAHFLTILGLTTLAAVTYEFAWEFLPALACAGLGSVVWSLEGAPAGRWLIGLTALALIVAVSVTASIVPPQANAYISLGADTMFPAMVVPAYGWRLADDLTSALLLGAATTAMLMGHSYLIASAMSLTPLFRLLCLLVAATLLRMALAGAGLWSWTAGHSLVNLEDETVLWLPLRWALGFVAPLMLTWMAWQTTRIRSTQSATGILYVAVIFCVLGELTSQLLVHITGFIL
jgi:hypothetical protein